MCIRDRLNNISRFGLLEMSRQRIKPALNDLMGKTIWVRSIASICESIFRLITEKSINNESSVLLLKVSPNVANELLNRYRPNLDDIERRFKTKIMTFIDPYKQNDSYTIEIKKNALFDYELSLEESSQAFQNKKSYNLNVPKKSTKALVGDVEFRNIPKSDKGKKGLLDSLFGLFKNNEQEVKPKRKPFKGKPKFSKGRKRKPFNPQKDNLKRGASNPRRNVKLTSRNQNGNVKPTKAEVEKSLPDDNIGNRKEEPVKTKKPVRRAKNDPRFKKD